MQTHSLFVIAALACSLQSCASTSLLPGPFGQQPSSADAPTSTTAQPAAARPAQDPQRRRGNGPWELTLGGAGTSNDQLDAGAAQATGSVGYYFTEVLEVSVRQNGSYSDAGQGASGVWNGTSRAAIDLHLPLGNFVPFVGVNFGYAYGDSVSDSMMAGPETGAKIYVKEDAFVLAMVEYQHFFDSDDSLNSAFEDGQLVYSLSLGLRF